MADDAMLHGLPPFEREPHSPLHGIQRGRPSALGERPSLHLVPKAWKQRALGQAKSGRALEEKLLSEGFRVSDTARLMLRSPEFSLSLEGEIAYFDRTSVYDLGFAFSARLEALVDRAWEKFGWEPCPGDASPELRLGYGEQKNGESVIVVTSPVILPNGQHALPRIERAGSDLWLCATRLDPYHEFPADTKLVFRHR